MIEEEVATAAYRIGRLLPDITTTLLMFGTCTLMRDAAGTVSIVPAERVRIVVEDE